MKPRFVLLLLFLSINSYAQTFLNGFVLDSIGEPLPWVASIVLYEDSTYISTGNDNEIGEIDSVWVQPVKYFSRTDNTGAFHLLIEDEKNINIEVQAYQFITKKIHLDSLPKEPIYINMEQDTSTNIKTRQSFKKKNWFTKATDAITLGLDINAKRYDAFEELIGEQNALALQRLPLMLTVEYGKVFNKVYTSIEYGIFPDATTEENGIDITSNGHLFAFHLGYELINYRKSYVMPKVSLKRYRYRLINNPDVDSVPLQVYLQDTDLDLRFIQPVADIGLTIGYKYRGKNWAVPGFILIGMSGGYAVSLRDEAKIKGLRSKISTEEGIDVGRLTMSFFFRSYFE